MIMKQVITAYTYRSCWHRHSRVFVRLGNSMSLSHVIHWYRARVAAVRAKHITDASLRNCVCGVFGFFLI